MGIKKYFQENINVSRKLILIYIITCIALSVYVTFLLHEQITTAFKHPFSITITATGMPGNEGADASEVWVSGISVNGFEQQLLDIRLENGWEYRNGNLLSYENQPAVLELLLPPGLIGITFTSHPWSGIVTIEALNGITELDLSLYEDTKELVYNVINYEHSTFEQVVRLSVVFVLIMMLLLLLPTAVLLIMKSIGVSRFLVSIIVIAILVNLIQFKYIDNPENHGRFEGQMIYARALYNTHDPNFIRLFGRHGLYFAIGSVGNSVNMIVPVDSGNINFNDLNKLISNVTNVEVLNFDLNTFLGILVPTLNDINPAYISNEQFSFRSQYLVMYNPYSDYVEELILLITEDNVILLLDTSLLSDEVYSHIQELRR